MPDLTGPEKRWIVARLAVFESPTAVVEEFKTQFGKVVTRQQVWEYDCSKEANRARRSQDLIDLFEEIRAEYQAGVKDVQIANKTWRMEQYQKLFDGAVKDGMRKTAAAILEQAAKDDGDAFTNKKDVTSGGQPIKAFINVDTDAV